VIIAVTETWLVSNVLDAVKLEYIDIAPVGYHHVTCMPRFVCWQTPWRRSYHVSQAIRSPTAPSQITRILWLLGSVVSNAFCDELSNIFDQLLLLSGQRQFVCGDFNSPAWWGWLLSGRILNIISNNWLRNQGIRRVTHLTLSLFQNNPAISFVTSPVIHWPLSRSLLARSSTTTPADHLVYTSRDINRILSLVILSTSHEPICSESKGYRVSCHGDSKKMWTVEHCTATATQHTSTHTDPAMKTVLRWRTHSVSSLSIRLSRIQQEISEITQTMNHSLFQTPRSHIGSPLVAFPDVSLAAVLKMLSSLPNKSSPRDILPTSLLKSCDDVRSTNCPSH